MKVPKRLQVTSKKRFMELVSDVVEQAGFRIFIIAASEIDRIAKVDDFETVKMVSARRFLEKQLKQAYAEILKGEK